MLRKSSLNKPFAIAAEQNKQAILPVLGHELNAGDRVLELGSGTGQHACYFAQQLPETVWQPSDLATQLGGITMWISDTNCANVLPPLELDVCALPWPALNAELIYSANTFHIISWHAIECIFLGSAQVLEPGGKLCVYGPFQIDGKFTAQSNAKFDQALRTENNTMGVRDTGKLNSLALENGFAQARMQVLPANNFLAVWERRRFLSH